MFVSGPDPYGQDVPRGRDFGEPGPLQPAFKMGSGARLHAAVSGRFQEGLVEMAGGEIGGEGSVGGSPFHVKVDTFDPAAWCGVPRWKEWSVGLCCVLGMSVGKMDVLEKSSSLLVLVERMTFPREWAVEVTYSKH